MIRNSLLLAATANGYQIPYSLRFRSPNGAHLTRTGSSVTASRWTVSFLAKLGFGSNQVIFCGYSNANNYTSLGVSSSNQLGFSNVGGGVTNVQLTTNAVFRDPTAWYHVAVFVDTTLSTAADRYQIWVNGTRITSFATNINTLAQNSGTYWNDNFTQYIGTFNASTNFYDGYISEFINTGQVAVNPSIGAFGAVDAASAAWIPTKYAGSYGTNGCYLTFGNAASTTTIGNDSSGNSNNWTSSGISVTSGSTFDQMTDTPTNNFSVLSQIDNPGGNGGVSAGNLQAATLTGDGHYRNTISMVSGSWYAECQLTFLSGSNAFVGIVDQSLPITSYPNLSSLGYTYANNALRWNNSASVAYGATWTTGDIIGIAFNATAGTLEFFKNGVSQGTAYTGIPAGNWMFCCFDGSSAQTATFIWNFGQRAFVYTPPTGFLKLNTANMASTSVTTSGSFTGNASTDGPFGYINGNPATLTINGNAVTFGTHADKTAGGFKLRTSSASYNAAGTNNWTATAGNRFVATNRVPNNAQVNP